jgi:CRP/FNR family transcriptional regulator, cyclic AMP receptor protein
VAARFNSAISLFEADPDLMARLDLDQALVAQSRAIAPVATLRPGDQDPWRWNGEADSHLALLVLDIVRPWDEEADDVSIPQTVTWTVHLPTRVALLDHRFAERVAPWPEIMLALLRRSVQRAQRVGRHLAILENPRVDARLLLLFWHLADCWGTVGPEGVTVPLPLTHKTLGRMVRAQRPSVTASLHELSERGLLTRRVSDGAWQLHGEPGLQMRLLLGDS